MTFRQRLAEIVQGAQLAGNFQQQVQAFVAEAGRLAADGLTLAEVGQLFVALITLAVDAAAQLANEGPQKKAFVLNAVAYLYDAIAPSIPLPMIVQTFRAWLRPYVRGLVLSLADGAIEAVYQRFQAPNPT
jgi:hypothetical protein